MRVEDGSDICYGPVPMFLGQPIQEPKTSFAWDDPAIPVCEVETDSKEQSALQLTTSQTQGGDDTGAVTESIDNQVVLLPDGPGNMWLTPTAKDVCECRPNHHQKLLEIVKTYDTYCQTIPCPCEADGVDCGPGECIPDYRTQTYTCYCPRGTLPINDGTGCSVDVCATQPCGNNGLCHFDESTGGYDCVCQHGYVATHDKNTGAQTCSPTQCQPNPCGNGLCREFYPYEYTCDCYEGYYYHVSDTVSDSTVIAEQPPYVVGGTCKDINECLLPCNCPENAICQNTPGSFTCTCSNGSTPDPELGCPITDACETYECPEYSSCINGTTEPTCEPDPGYECDDHVCTPIDYCNDDLNPCGANFICEDGLAHAPTCVCPEPYYKENTDVHPTTCHAIDACDNANGVNPCSEFADCTCGWGRYPTCTCRAPGYVGDGVHCEWVDLCADHNGGCSDNAECTNAHPQEAVQPASFMQSRVRECALHHALVKGNDSSTQSDIAGVDTPAASSCDVITLPAETEAMTAHALLLLETRQTTGGPILVTSGRPEYVTCECLEGYSGDGYTCEPINHCEDEATNDCTYPNLCENLGPGEHTCGCPCGYEGDGVGEDGCTDIDECQALPCPPNTKCENQEGSYDCICPTPAYEWVYDDMNSKQCRWVDQCTQDPYPCAALATCSSTEEHGTTCTCPPWYTGDPFTECVAVDVCENNNGPCLEAPIGQCTHNPGMPPACSCYEPFYLGDGTSHCEEQDLCQHGVGTDPWIPPSCGPNEECSQDGPLCLPTCVCKDRFDLVDGQCIDHLECAVPDICGDYEDCIEQIGAPPLCQCKPGYYRDNHEGECMLEGPPKPTDLQEWADFYCWVESLSSCRSDLPEYGKVKFVARFVPCTAGLGLELRCYEERSLVSCQYGRCLDNCGEPVPCLGQPLLSSPFLGHVTNAKIWQYLAQYVDDYCTLVPRQLGDDSNIKISYSRAPPMFDVVFGECITIRFDYLHGYVEWQHPNEIVKQRVPICPLEYSQVLLFHWDNNSLEILQMVFDKQLNQMSRLEYKIDSLGACLLNHAWISIPDMALNATPMDYFDDLSIRLSENILDTPASPTVSTAALAA